MNIAQHTMSSDVSIVDPAVDLRNSDDVLELSVLLIDRGPYWVGISMEPHLATQAETEQTVLDQLREMVSFYAELAREQGVPIFNGMPPAPESYRETFERLMRGDRAKNLKATVLRIPRSELEAPAA